MSEPLSEYKWRDRLILIFEGEAGIAGQKVLLERDEAGCEARDLRAIYSPGEEIRESFGVEGGSFAVILVGKDGTEKARFERPVEPEEIFRLVDEMPMRRREARGENS